MIYKAICRFLFKIQTEIQIKMLGVYLVHISVTKLVNGVIKLIQLYVGSVGRLRAGELWHANIRHGTVVGVFGVAIIKVMLHFGEE
jgi:hypothetical protein